MAASRYDTVLAALDAGVVVHGADTSILEANDRARALLGIRDLDGRPATDPAWNFFEADMTAMALDRFPVMQVIASHQPLRQLVMVVRPPDAADLFVEVNALPRFDAAGELIEVVVTFIDVTEREARHRHTELLNSQLAEIAITDDLTQLSNRRGIIETARSALAWARRHSQPLSVLMIDLDHFKQVNDRFGHAGGDAMLLAMAIRITESLRSQDSVGRFGGEEFLAVLPGADAAAAREIAERIRAQIECAGGEAHVTASVGVVTLDAGESLDSAILRADKAMYRAKAAGRNLVRVAP